MDIWPHSALRLIVSRADHGAAIGVLLRLGDKRWTWRFRNPFVRTYSQAEFERRKRGRT